MFQTVHSFYIKLMNVFISYSNAWNTWLHNAATRQHGDSQPGKQTQLELGDNYSVTRLHALQK